MSFLDLCDSLFWFSIYRDCKKESKELERELNRVYPKEKKDITLPLLIVALMWVAVGIISIVLFAE